MENVLNVSVCKQMCGLCGQIKYIVHFLHKNELKKMLSECWAQNMVPAKRK